MVLCVLTVCVGNTNRGYHHELEAEHYLRAQEYDKVLKVGKNSLEASRTLTVFRAVALSHLGQMGDKLFAYPQYYRSDGLFFDADSLHTLRYTNDSIYYLLGGSSVCRRRPPGVFAEHLLQGYWKVYILGLLSFGFVAGKAAGSLHAGGSGFLFARGYFATLLSRSGCTVSCTTE